MTDPRREDARSVRLEANVSPLTAKTFRELIARKNISITEGVRRAIAVWRFVEDEVAAGNCVAIVDPNGTVRQVTLFDALEDDRG